jgi:hypothetical protein
MKNGPRGKLHQRPFAKWEKIENCMCLKMNFMLFLRKYFEICAKGAVVVLRVC